MHPPFPKKSYLRISKNYRGITLTLIAAKDYRAQLSNHIKPKIEKILSKNQNGFRRNRSMTSQILTIRRILGVHTENIEATIYSRFLHPEGRWSKYITPPAYPTKPS